MSLRAAVFKYRGLLWGVFAAAIFIFPVSFSYFRTALALPLLVGGQALRFWAAGVIPKYRTLVIGAPVLVTWGPYARIRNPLYAGNALMGTGWSLMAGWLWAPAFAVVFLTVYSLVIIPDEEKFLAERFGEEYERFRRDTPSLIPRPGGAPRAEKQGEPFDWGKSWFMERHSLRMNLLVSALLLARMLWAGA